MSQPTRNIFSAASPGAKANLLSVMSAADLPGSVGADGEITVNDMVELNAWFGRFREQSSLVTASRYEIRGGQLFGLGGLDWQLTLRGVPGVDRVTVRAVTGEREPLPDLPVVRAGFPYGIRSAVVRGVAA